MKMNTSCAEFSLALDATNVLSAAGSKHVPASMLAHAEGCDSCSRLLLERLLESQELACRPVEAMG
jgi:hypothetical protein